MDDLLYLIFIVIIAIASLVGKALKPKEKTGAESQEAGGWIAKLNTFLTDLQDKVEQQNNVNASSSSQWDEYMDDEEEEDEDRYDADEYSLSDLELQEEQIQPRIVAEKEPPAPPVRIEGLDSVEVPSQALAESKVAGSVMSKSRQDLRNAIIWSEIIGPPVALRGPSGKQN